MPDFSRELKEIYKALEDLKAKVSTLRYQMQEYQAQRPKDNLDLPDDVYYPSVGCDADAHVHAIDKLRTGDGC